MRKTFITNRFIRSGGSYAIGTIIDEYLSEEQRTALYGKWKKSWPEPLAFSGNQQAITCELIQQVPQEEFVKVMGAKVAPGILDVVARNAGR